MRSSDRLVGNHRWKTKGIQLWERHKALQTGHNPRHNLLSFPGHAQNSLPTNTVTAAMGLLLTELLTETLPHEWVRKDWFLAKCLRLSYICRKKIPFTTVMKIFVVSDLKVRAHACMTYFKSLSTHKGCTEVTTLVTGTQFKN